MCRIDGRTADHFEGQVSATGRIVPSEPFYDDCITRKDQKVRTGENDSVIIDVVLCVRLSAIV